MKRASEAGVLMLVIMALVVTSGQSAVIDVSGQVVDQDGAPVAGAQIARIWHFDETGRRQTFKSSRSDADGRFTLECDFYTLTETAVMAMDGPGERGGIAVIRSSEPAKPLKIELGPLVEVVGHFACAESGKAPVGTEMTIHRMPGYHAIARCHFKGSTFSLRLPPGPYTFHGGGSSDDYVEIQWNDTLKSGERRDLGAVDLKLSPIARQYGKKPPPWHFTDARGVRKNVTIDDFRGKWLVLDFWFLSCQPCVGSSLPNWIDFCEEHAAHRDRFEILAIHDDTVRSFAMLDSGLKPIIKTIWRGRPLPFPTVLDATGETIENFGVRAFPTVVLVNPEGILVQLPPEQSAEQYLAAKLPPLPFARRLAAALEGGLYGDVSDNANFGQWLEYLAKQGRIPIYVDDDALKAASVDNDTPLPLTVSGRLALRSWLNLTLVPFGLTYVPDGRGLRVVSKTTGNGVLAAPSARDRAENDRLEKWLKQSVPFDFHAEPLKNVVALLAQKTGERFVLDPIARKAGTIAPTAVVTGRSRGQPLGLALNQLLEPLGMTCIVRDEAIVLTKGP